MLEQFTQVEPRDYQKRVITQTLKYFLEDDLQSVLIESPTGSGKTIMALLISKLMQQKLNIKIGWVAQRRNLLLQAERENIIKEIGADIQYISMFDKDPPAGVEMLIIDEAQHDSCNSCLHIHNTLKPKYILGMTATPFRTDRVKLCFDKVVKDAGIKCLIEQGYLSQYHHYSVPNWDVDNIAHIIASGNWGKTIVFFHTIAQCQECSRFLAERGIKSEVITGSTDREKQLERFKHGDVDVVINCLVLTEGFDFPGLETVFCRPSCKGVTIQMAGRVFRKFPSIPHKKIVQCKQTKWPFLKTALPKMQYILEQDEWRSIGANDNVRIASQSSLRSLAKIDVKLPKILTQQKERQRRGRSIL